MDFTPVLDHLKEYYGLYIVAVILLGPAIFFTRRWSLPIIFYALETIIYIGCMHVAVGVVTRVARWFKDQSSMKRAFDTKEFKPPDWTTPWLEFWNKEGYVPQTLFYVEIAFAVLIIFLVWRYRPVRVKRRPSTPSKKADQYLQDRGMALKGRGGRK